MDLCARNMLNLHEKMDYVMIQSINFEAALKTVLFVCVCVCVCVCARAHIYKVIYQKI
jgi:hypothetical protein